MTNPKNEPKEEYKFQQPVRLWGALIRVIILLGIISLLVYILLENNKKVL